MVSSLNFNATPPTTPLRTGQSPFPSPQAPISENPRKSSTSDRVTFQGKKTKGNELVVRGNVLPNVIDEEPELSKEDIALIQRTVEIINKTKNHEILTGKVNPHWRYSEVVASTHFIETKGVSPNTLQSILLSNADYKKCLEREQSLLDGGTLTDNEAAEREEILKTPMSGPSLWMARLKRSFSGPVHSVNADVITG